MPRPTMTSPRRGVAVSWLCCTMLCAMPSQLRAQTDMLKPIGSPWDVLGNIPAGTDISGIACVPVAGKSRNCIIAVDEGFSAVVVTLNGKTVKPGGEIRLLHKKADEELDAEGAAYDPRTGAFYVIGSHGKRRHACNANPSSFNLVKIPVKAKTGRPRFGFNDKGEDFVAREIVVAQSLKAAMLASAKIAPHVDKCLPSKKGKHTNEHGVNIEGLAVLGNRLFVGFRGPVHGNTAYMMAFERDSLFPAPASRRKPKAVEAKTIEIDLGTGMGVRDLATVKGGLLILSGPEDDAPGNAAVHFFQDSNGTTTRLGTLPDLTSTAKPEALLLLEETPAAYRVLVLSDSAKNGEPTEFLIDKKN